MNKKYILIPTLALMLAITGCQNNENKTEEPKQTEVKVEDQKTDTKEVAKESENKKSEKIAKDNSYEIIPDKNFTASVDIEEILKAHLNSDGKVDEDPTNKSYENRLLNMGTNELYTLLDHDAALSLAKKYGIELKDEDVIEFTKDFYRSNELITIEDSILDDWKSQVNMFGWENIAKGFILSYTMSEIVDEQTENFVLDMTDEEKEKAIEDYYEESNKYLLGEEEAKIQAYNAYAASTGVLEEVYRDFDYYRLASQLKALKIIFPEKYKNELNGKSEDDYINEKLDNGYVNPPMGE